MHDRRGVEGKSKAYEACFSEFSQKDQIDKQPSHLFVVRYIDTLHGETCHLLCLHSTQPLHDADQVRELMIW